MPEDSKEPGGVTESVLPSSSSDQPTQDDKLGFEPYVRALASFLTHAQTRGPLAVSIEGEWGSGKSSFMLQLEEELLGRSEEADPGRPRPLIVRFNAWRHEKEDALWAAFALHFTREISSQQPFLHRSWCHIRLFVRRFGWWEGWPQAARALLFSLLFAIVAIALPVATYRHGWRSVSQLAYFLVPNSDAKSSVEAKPPQIPLARGASTRQPEESQAEDAATKWNEFQQRLLKGLLASGGFLGYATVLILLWDKLSKYFTNPFEIDLKRYLETPNYKDRVSFVESFHEDFSKVVAALAPNRTIFVFIDDLDRCEVPRAADLMQALNLMISENPQLIFILGMDREKVAAGLAVKNEKSLPYLLSLQSSRVQPTADSIAHRGLEYGYEFIEKFIQIAFLVPRATSAQLDQMVRSLSQPPSVAPASGGFVQSLRRWWSGRQASAISAPRSRNGRMSQREAAEKRRERIALRAADDSETIRTIVQRLAPALDYNPRRLKQFVNLFRLRVFIAAETGLFDPSEGLLPGQELTLQQLGKFTALLLRWPLLVSELDQEPTLLAQLEDLVIKREFNNSNPLLRRWSYDLGLRSLLGVGCVGPDSKPDNDLRLWSVANLKTDKLLQVSPRVRSIRISREATPSGQDRSSDETGTSRSAEVKMDGSYAVRSPVNARGSADDEAAPTAQVSTAEIFAAMPSRFNREAAKGLSAVYQFNLTGDAGGTWYVRIDNDKCEVHEGAHSSPDITISMSAQDYVDMTTGKLDGQKAFMERRLSIKGDTGKALRMQSLFS
jgi:putative sterol carrier protein